MVRPAQRQRERREYQRYGRQGDGGAHGASTAHGPYRAEHDQGEQRRPEEIELLLDSEGPEVQQRALLLPGGEVVGPLRDEAPVGGGERRHDHVVLQVGAPQRNGQPGPGQGHRAEDDGGGGQEPTGPPGEEVQKPDPAGGDRLTDEQAGDEVAGHDEEDVHADESARETRNPGVEGEDREDGDGAQPLDVGPERRAVRAGPGLAAGAGRGARGPVGGAASRGGSARGGSCRASGVGVAGAGDGAGEGEGGGAGECMEVEPFNSAREAWG